MGDRAVRSAAGVIVRLGVALAALLALPSPALAWGFYGHTVIAQIAQANVTPGTRAALDRLYGAAPLIATPQCSLRNLEDAAVWPDCLRGDPDRWAYTFAWHYQTEPVCEDYSVRKNCPGGACVAGQIERNFKLLSDKALPANVRLEALAFLVHFVGDIHMPLHSGDDGDKGGNDRKAAYGIVPGLNLHRIWDGPLAERAISGDASVVRRYSVAEKAELTTGGIADWGRESWALARDFVYPDAFGEAPCKGDLPGETALSQEAIAKAVPIVRRRVEQAGLRLAKLLDQAMAPQGIRRAG